MELFERIWQLEVVINEKRKIYQHLSMGDSGLRIQFKVESSVNTIPSNGQITIYNLPNEDVAFMSTNYIPNTGALKPSQIKLSAGYRDTGLGVMLIGNIATAQPNFTDPDNSIKLGVMSGLQANEHNWYASTTIAEKATFRDVCANIAKQAGWKLDYNERIPNKVLKDYSFKGSPLRQIDNLRLYYEDLDMYVSNDVLRVQPKKNQGKTKAILRHDTGMLGSPLPTPQGCEVTSLLRHELYPGDFVEIDSKKIPKLNNVYRIMTVIHSGDTTESDWSTKMILIKA